MKPRVRPHSVTIPDVIWESVELIAETQYHENLSATITELVKDGILVTIEKFKEEEETYRETLRNLPSELVLQSEGFKVNREYYVRRLEDFRKPSSFENPSIKNKLYKLTEDQLDSLLDLLEKYVYEIKQFKQIAKTAIQAGKDAAARAAAKDERMKKVMDEAFGF